MSDSDTNDPDTAGKRSSKSSETPLRSEIGYKRPPIHHRFQKGHSGNPRGRSKGHRNIANMTLDALTRPVRVRSDGEVWEVQAVEAIFRLLINKAAAGDRKATALVNRLREMAGEGFDLTNEERDRRAIYFPEPLTEEDFDLLNAPAREKDRQRYLAMADFKESAVKGARRVEDNGRPISPEVKAGDELAAQGKFEFALDSYRRELVRCKSRLGFDKSDIGAQDDFRRAVARIGLLADRLLFAGQFASAMKFADEAAKDAKSESWIQPVEEFCHPHVNAIWIDIILAHARMLNGRVAEARSFYRNFSSHKNICETSWETSILQDFIKLRRKGFRHDLMEEIERHFAAEGWTIKSGPAGLPTTPAIGGEQAVFIQMNPDQMRSGDLLLEHGRPSDAADVYLRAMKKCHKEIADNGPAPEWDRNLSTVSSRLVLSIHNILLTGDAARALDCIDQAQIFDTNNHALDRARAHALAMRGRDGEARSLYLRHCGAGLGDPTWEQSILKDIEEFREAGRYWPLMDEIPTLLRSNEMSTGMAQPGARTISGKSISALVQRDDIPSGNELLSEGKLDEALIVFKRRIQACERTLSSGRPNMQASDDRHAAVTKITDISLAFLLHSQDEKALETANYAVSVIQPAGAFAIARHAHALMFLGKEDEARALYHKHRGEKATQHLTVDRLILEDFDVLRKAGRMHPVMDEIETEICASEIALQPGA